MATTITDAFQLPRPEDIRAMGFVVKLREAAPDSDEVKQLVSDYVITPAVEKELPRILDDMKQVFDRGEEYGRFIHGSFGSGKSHFMTMLSLLVEGASPALAKFRPLLAAHRDAQKSKGHDAGDPEVWLGKANLLVVRIHMLSVRGKRTGLDRAVYDGLNAALKRRNKEPFEFLNVQAIFDEVRRDVAEYGEIVWKRLEAEGIVGGRKDFEALEAGSVQARENFARAWLAYKGRSAADAGIDPRWSEGLRRMGAHAKAQGFGGIVLMIDEFLLWLAEKSGQEFVEEINNLNVIVDHNTGQRPLPIFVFVARQRNLQEFFPDLVDESKIHEHLDHHSKRFEETRLQDVELRHIVRGRVLARQKDPAAIAKAVGALAQTHDKLLPALLAGGDIDYLRDVYPFHPALIEMLVDVSSLMQRERSALRLLYELLVIHNPTLPLGEFIPVGSAFAAIFPESGVEASKKRETMEDIHHQYYVRLIPAMKIVAEETGPDFTPERARALDQLVKTVLLAEVSPRLKQTGGLTIERLVQLNSVDIDGETFRGQVRIAETDLTALQRKIADLQISGPGKTGIVKYILGRVSLTEYLARARSKVDNINKRFETFWPALKRALGVDGKRGFEEGGKSGDWSIVWRKTTRIGSIQLGNVREMSNEDFKPPAGAFKVLVDYPWDEPGHTVDEDRHRAANVRKKVGQLYTVCWLPRHMSPAELATITELAAVRYLRSKAGQEDLLASVSPNDRSALLELAETREGALESQLAALIDDVYIKHGEFAALISDVDGRRPLDTVEDNLKYIAGLLMDRQFPQHPSFLAEPKRADLQLLLDWMLQAGETNVSISYDEPTGKALKNLGAPLELVNLGQTKAALRLDSRYIKDVMTRTDQDSVKWNPIADHLRETYGFLPEVVDMFLCFLCQRDHRALGELDREPLKVRIGMPAAEQIRLERGKLVSAADWHALRDLGHELLGEARPGPHRSLQGQDRYAIALRGHADERRDKLSALQSRLVGLGAPHGARLTEISQAHERLGPLVQVSTDSHKVLTEFLAAWPSDDSSPPLRSLVNAGSVVLAALSELDEHSRRVLRNGLMHPVVGVDVEAHLAALDSRLGASNSEQPIDKAWIDAWNTKARALVHRLVEQPAPASQATPPVPTASAAQPPPNASLAFPTNAPELLLRMAVDPRDAEEVNRFVAKVREVVRSQSGVVHLTLAREEKPE